MATAQEHRDDPKRASQPENEAARQAQVENEAIEQPIDPTAEEAQRTADQLNAADGDAPETAAKPEAGKDEVETPDDVRAKITKGYEARRRKSSREWTGSLTDPAVLAGADVAAKTLEPEAEAAPEQPATDQPAPRMVKVKVDGKEIEVSEAELTRNFQVTASADQRMQEATRLLDQARREREEFAAMVREGKTPAPTKAETQEPTTVRPPTPQPAAPTDPLAALTDDEWAEIVNGLQVGSTDEAKKAVIQLASKIAAPQQPLDIGGVVKSILAQERETEKTKGVIKRFVDEYPGLEDSLAGKAFLAAFTEREMVKDFLSIGIAPELLQGKPSNFIREKHAEFRRDFPDFARSPEQMFVAVKQDKEFRALAPQLTSRAPVTVDLNTELRGQRKQGVQPQPAQRTVPPRPQAQNPQGDRHQRAAAQIAKSRGQVHITVN